jgi:hypothetical protein
MRTLQNVLQNAPARKTTDAPDRTVAANLVATFWISNIAYA